MTTAKDECRNFFNRRERKGRRESGTAGDGRGAFRMFDKATVPEGPAAIIPLGLQEFIRLCFPLSTSRFFPVSMTILINPSQ